VIGVNFAVFTENQASNFAVPIQYGITLLGRAGWTEPPEKDPTAEADPSQSELHASALSGMRQVLPPGPRLYPHLA